MRRIYSLFLLFSVAVLFSACGGGGMGGMVKGESFVTEGWVDENTFRVVEVGVPKKGLENKTQRRATAKQAAQLMAQARVIEKFKGARLEGASGAADYELTGIAVSKEFSGVVKGGSIIKSTFNDDDSCEIVYEVRAKNLRKMVEKGPIVEK